jgi:hypothetical protein
LRQVLQPRLLKLADLFLYNLVALACPQPEFERLCGAVGEIGEGGVFVEAHSLW